MNSSASPLDASTFNASSEGSSSSSGSGASQTSLFSAMAIHSASSKADSSSRLGALCNSRGLDCIGAACVLCEGPPCTNCVRPGTNFGSDVVVGAGTLHRGCTEGNGGESNVCTPAATTMKSVEVGGADAPNIKENLRMSVPLGLRSSSSLSSSSRGSVGCTDRAGICVPSTPFRRFTAIVVLSSFSNSLRLSVRPSITRVLTWFAHVNPRVASFLPSPKLWLNHLDWSR